MARKAKAIGVADLFGDQAAKADVFETHAKEQGKGKVKKKVKEKRKIPRYEGGRNWDDKNLLALDIATVTGFCVFNRSGIHDFTPKTNDSKGMRLMKFKAAVIRFIEEYKIKLIVFESQAVFGNKRPNFVASEMIGVLKIYCEEHGIEYRSYTPAEIKQSATGKGNADKDQMLEHAQSKFDIVCADNNEADALHIYHLAIEDLKL